MNITNVLQTNEPLNLLLKASIENELSKKFIKDENSDYMTDTGESAADYCAYSIPIDENHNLFIDFVDFGVHSYFLKKVTYSEVT